MKNINFFKHFGQQLMFVVLIILSSVQLQGQSQCNPDITPPVAICDQNIVLKLDAKGQAELRATILDDGSYDNCSMKLKYSFTSNVNDTIRSYNSSSPKSFNQFLYLTDEAGNNSNCIVDIKIDDCNSVALTCNSSINISVLEGETVRLTAEMMLEGGPYCPFSQYEVWLVDKNGKRLKAEIDENTETPITMHVRNKVTGSECWGNIGDIKVIKCKSTSLACSDEVIVKVPKGDSVKLWASMLLEGGPYCPNSHYNVILTDTNGIDYVNPYVNENTQSPIQYKVEDIKSGNACWGNLIIQVIDCKGGLPKLECPKDLIISCQVSVDPENTGFPLDTSIFEISRSNNRNTYTVANWDSCDAVTLKYVDRVTTFNCTGDYSQIIDRTWTVSNAKKESNSCFQSLSIPYDTIPDDVGLHNYDGVDKPFIDCNGTWPKLVSGAPDPSFTGHPLLSNCGFISFKYDDIVFKGGCNVPIKVLRTWTILDWCKQTTNEVKQILKFEGCDKDNSPPVAICDSKLFVSLSFDGTAKIFAQTIDNGSYDDCGIATYSFDKAGKELFREFDVSDIGKHNVSMFVTDYSGKQSVCLTEIEIVDKRVKGDPIIGGRFLDYDLKPITNKDVKIKQQVFDNDLNLLSTNFCANPTNLPLDYTICTQDKIPSVPLYFKAVMDETNQSSFNGISTKDLVYIQKYLLKKQNFNNIQKVAGDVNCSGLISPADMIWLRSLILGKRNSLPCGNWKILEPNLNNVKEFSPHTVNKITDYTVDMVPVKLGDVTGDWMLKDGKVKTRSGKTVEMVIEDHELIKGQEFDMWVKVENTFEFVGLQMAIAYDKDEIIVKKIESPFFAINESQYAIYDNETRWVLVHPSADSYFVKDAWIKITVEAKVDGKISEMISVPANYNAVYVDENVQESPIRLYIGAMVGTDDQSFENKPVISPNPFDHQINISLIDNVLETGSIELYDMNGTLIYTNIIREGQNLIVLDANEIGMHNGGMYYVKIMIGNKVHVEKLVRVN